MNTFWVLGDKLTLFYFFWFDRQSFLFHINFSKAYAPDAQDGIYGATIEEVTDKFGDGSFLARLIRTRAQYY